jgi:predicted amidophosphoribosyltransferase
MWQKIEIIIPIGFFLFVMLPRMIKDAKAIFRKPNQCPYCSKLKVFAENQNYCRLCGKRLVETGNKNHYKS